MKNVYEIRFHGRGGQGAKTASILLAKSAAAAGKYIQAFPDYGAERAGAPMKSYAKISDTELRDKSKVTHPNMVAVLDETLIGADVVSGLDDDAIVVINTSRSPAQIRKKLIDFKGTICTVDATAISLELFNKNIPNTAVTAAMTELAEVLDVNALKKEIEHKFNRKYGQAIIDKNYEAVDKAIATMQIDKGIKKEIVA